jgi:hypothetical protein
MPFPTPEDKFDNEPGTGVEEEEEEEEVSLGTWITFAGVEDIVEGDAPIFERLL